MDKDRIERSPCRLRREVGEVIEIITNFAVGRCQVNCIDAEVPTDLIWTEFIPKRITDPGPQIR